MLQGTYILFFSIISPFFFLFIFVWVLAYCYYIHPTMAPSNILFVGNLTSIKSPFEGSFLKNIKYLSNRSVIWPTCMKLMFLREYRPYENLSRGIRREFFTEILDRIFCRLVTKFYSNIKTKGLALTTQVKRVQICIDIWEFGKLYELPYYGILYKYDGTSKFKRFNQNIVIVIFVEDPMVEKKLPLKTKFLKTKCQVMHYMLTQIFLHT